MARFTNGWVKVHRKLVEEDIGQRGNFALGLFVRILRMANWRDGSSPVGGQRVTLQPGQLVTGLRELSPNIAEDPHLHRTRNALAYLVKRGTITQATSNQGRIITICNWEEYQFSDSEAASNNASEAQAERRQGAGEAQHIEEVKNVRKEEVCKGALPNSKLVAEKKPLDPKELESLYETWLATLDHFKSGRKNILAYEQEQLVRAVQRVGSATAVRFALIGARFEPKDERFDPSKFLKVARIVDKDNFDRFMNLGIQDQNRRTARE